MDLLEIVVPRASWSDVFSDDAENPLIPGVPRSIKPRKGPAAMHLPCPSFLSKQWGEVHTSFNLIKNVAPKSWLAEKAVAKQSHLIDDKEKWQEYRDWLLELYFNEKLAEEKERYIGYMVSYFAATTETRATLS